MHLTRLYSSTPYQEDELQSFKELGIRPHSVAERTELTRLLHSYLCYPSDRLALIHAESNRLGVYDEDTTRHQLKREFITGAVIYETCQCCCSFRQTALNCCIPLSHIITLDTAHRHFFDDLVLTQILMVASLLIYALYAFISNIVAANQIPTSCFPNEICSLARIASGAKLYDAVRTSHTQYLFVVQAYLGLAMCCVWIGLFIWKVIVEKGVELQQDAVSPTVANFSVMIENLPSQITVEMLQIYLNEYAMRSRSRMIHPSSSMYPLDTYDVMYTISALNTAKDYYQTMILAQEVGPSPYEIQLGQRIETLRNMVLFRGYYGQFEQPFELRTGMYIAVDQLRAAVSDERVRSLQYIENLYRQNSAYKSTKIVFVTFNHTFAKINLLRLNSRGPFWWLNCCRNKEYLLNIPGAVVEEAPEPEDIIWENIGAPLGERIRMKMITYLISFLLLGASFGIIFGLAVAQKQGNNVTLSLLISFVVSIINVLLSLAIQYLTVFQKDWTSTSYQSSVGFKIIFCQLINTIVLEIIVALYAKNQKIYQTGGLVDDVFYYGLLNAFFPPLVRFINPYYIYKKCSLSMNRRPINKLKFESQVEYNMLWENPEFQIGLEYTYPVKTVIYTAFFMPLQPIIVLFSLIGLVLMYHAEKFTLFYRSRRPRSSSKLITFAMKNILYFCIIAYGFGSLTWSNFYINAGPHRAFIPSVIAIALGVIFIGVILSEVIDYSFRNNYSPKIYDNERMFFPSEYDRLNPTTRARGVKRYRQYVNKKRSEIPIFNGLEANLLNTNNPHDLDAILQMSKYIPPEQNNNILNQIPYLPPVPAHGLIRPPLIDMTSSQMFLSIRNKPPAVLDPSTLNNVINNNQQPGKQKPNLYSSKYNPLDYIEAVNSDPNNPYD